MRIINGSRVQQTSPYHGLFALPTKSSLSDTWLGCGASIISPTYAMTSMHCFGGGLAPCQGPKKLAIWVGDVELDNFLIVPNQSGRSHRVEAELVCHPDFDGKCSHGHDVALLKLKDALPDWATPVPLNLDAAGNMGVGDTVTAIGFGLTEGQDKRVINQGVSSVLRQVSVTVLAQDDDKCKRMYSGGWGCSDQASEGAATNLDMQLCAGATNFPDRDTCSGDSGSPVMDASGNQVGIVSYGGGPGEKMSGPGRICGDPEYPGIYAQVSAFSDFIRANVKDLPGAL